MVIRAAAVLLALGSVACANVLQNPGFESGLDAWQTSAGSAVYTSDPSMPRSGLASVRGVEPNSGSLGRLFQDLTSLLVVGEQYTISGWIKTQDVAGGGGASFGLHYVNANWATPADGHVKLLGLVTGSRDWTFFQSSSFTLPAMPPSSSSLCFALDFSASSGTAWFDDLDLSGPVVPEPASVLLAALLAVPLAARRCGKATGR